MQCVSVPIILQALAEFMCADTIARIIELN